MRYSTVISGDETSLLTTVEEQLNLPTGQDNTLLQLYIGAARDFVEKFCNRGLIRQEVTLRLDVLSGKKYIETPLSPIVTVQDSVINIADIVVMEIDETGTESDISDVVIYVDINIYPNRIYLDTDYDFVTNPIGYKVIYSVGQSDITNIDSVYQNAILLMVAEMYSNRENPARTMQTLAEKILSPFRVHYYE